MIDAETLLAPISGNAPTGRDLREAADDRTHRAIREARSGGESGDPRTANWSAIGRQCEEALAKASKDLELAGWLAEALARTEGFPGLKAGLALIRELTTRYWDEVHPRGIADADPPDFSSRMARLNWLASDRGGLLPSVRAIGFAGTSDQRAELLGWEAYLASQRVAQAAATNQTAYQEMLSSGLVTPEQWSNAIGATPPERLRNDAQAARACAQEARAIEALTEERDAAGGANLHGLTALLIEIAEYIEARLPRTDSADAAQGTGAQLALRAAAVGSGPIGSRADALARLSEVARLFRDSEPHSPVSRLVERAVRWGNMSFEELLRDVVKSESALNEIWDTLGVKPPEQSS